MLTRRLIYIATFALFSNIVSAQLGVKFEKVDDPFHYTKIARSLGRTESQM